MEKKVDNLITNTIRNLKDILDVNSVIGKPMKISEMVTIIPICKMTMGLVTGGSEVGKDKIKASRIDNYAGGSGTGVNFTPIGIISVVADVVKYIPLGKDVPYYDIIDKVENIALNIIDKVEKKDDKK